MAIHLKKRSRLSVVVLFALLAALPMSAGVTQIELPLVASGLDQPTTITNAGDARLFVTEQTGRVRVIEGGALRETPFLDLRSIVFCGTGGPCGERGLLGVAFHPRYQENGLFFVFYNDLEGDIVVARYSVSSDPNRAAPGSGAIILEIEHKQFTNHNGGQLQFGPDGYLYIGTGDGGGGGDPLNSGQSLGTLLGKILRIDVDTPPYAVPASNPFVSTAGARGEIWAWGLRNPWRFSFDRLTGDLWIADVGQNRLEEINLQPFTSGGGENYGWRRMEGSECFNPSTNCDDGSLKLPIIEYGRAGSACSVTGGYRYRGTRSPRLRGTYIFGDFCNGLISGATQRLDGTWETRPLVDTSFFISTFGEDHNGEVYVADRRGTVHHIVDASPAQPRRRAVRR